MRISNHMNYKCKRIQSRLCAFEPVRRESSVKVNFDIPTEGHEVRVKLQVQEDTLTKAHISEERNSSIRYDAKCLKKMYSGCDDMINTDLKNESKKRIYSISEIREWGRSE